MCDPHFFGDEMCKYARFKHTISEFDVHNKQRGTSALAAALVMIYPSLSLAHAEL